MEPLKTIGKIKRISDTQQITDSFKKREFVIETDEQYVQTIGFEVIQDKTSLLDTFQVGQTVEVFFNLRGRKFSKDESQPYRVFNSLHAWRIQDARLQEHQEPTQSKPNQESNFDDDLPF